MKNNKHVESFGQFNENLNISSSSETIDARKIVINSLKMYNLTEVEEMNYHADLANEIINDLVNAGLLLSNLSKEDAYVIERIIDKDLKIGMGSNINKIIQT